MEASKAGEEALFRVSDVYEVPRRGYMIRLKLLGGKPSMKRLGRGASLRLDPPDGPGRVATVTDVGVTSGRARQSRLDRTGELDVLVSREDALGADAPVRIGWSARTVDAEG